MNIPTIIATHSGSHHADDCFGVAVLRMLHPDARIVRTREPQLIAAADYAVDVGGEWDPSRGRFDHHQKGFVGKRANSGVVYASAGLVWEAQGRQLIAMLNPDLSEQDVQVIHWNIDDELVQHLDMADTGAAQGAPGLFGLSALLAQFNRTRVENEGLAAFAGPDRAYELTERARFDAFMGAVAVTQQLLQRVIAQAYDERLGNKLVREGERLFGGAVLVLPVASLSWAKVVCEEMPEVLFVVYPDSSDRQYQVRTVPVEPESFKARRDLPAAWAGLRDQALADLTGVPDAVFCHNGRFIGGAVSKEGAIAMAKLALQDQ
ncbi:hypothetical protein D3C71_24940 [compost metagenome]